uniref:HECT domain-containing protein n=1 Tax=Euplotes crassus TaxID=5936 RepID=A0A7S3K931_EUPCR|mmetsp:Transcript_15636/g.15437  ORF Transcript_15636/g.15437 Transcript_15636/m.15437 type:complete len:213 (+) Transcript_15636:66-704(+)
MKAKESMTKEEFEESVVLKWKTTQSNGELVYLKSQGTDNRIRYEDVEEYCSQVIKTRSEEFSLQIEALIKGFNLIVPLYIGKILSWQEFEERIRGPNEISAEVLQSITTYPGCSSSNEGVKRFWRVFKAFSNEEKSRFLKFVWGRDRLPIKSKLKAEFKLDMYHNSSAANDAKLPTSATCYFRLYIPNYTTDEICRSQLLLAINSCGEIDND